jgi:hypothetical protein
MLATALPIPLIRRRQTRHTSCPHINTQQTTTGSIRIFAGEIEDTTKDELICLDCGRIVRQPVFTSRHVKPARY